MGLCCNEKQDRVIGYIAKEYNPGIKLRVNEYNMDNMLKRDIFTYRENNILYLEDFTIAFISGLVRIDIKGKHKIIMDYNDFWQIIIYGNLYSKKESFIVDWNNITDENYTIISVLQPLYK